MKRIGILTIWLACACLSFWLAGCGDAGPGLSAEIDDPVFKEGKNLVKEGRPDQALAAFLKVIVKRGDQAPESHLEAGIIELVHAKDPISAIYHFRKYLEYAPHSRDEAKVRDLIDRANREYASTLPLHPLDSQGSQDIAEDYNRLLHENAELKAELLALRRTTGAADPSQPLFSVPSQEPASASAPPEPIDIQPEKAAPKTGSTPAPAQVEAVPVAQVEGAQTPASPAPARSAASASHTHTVAKGDNLYKLAVRYLGSGSAANKRAIIQANSDQLSGDNPTLRIGMVLRIPQAP